MKKGLVLLMCMALVLTLGGFTGKEDPGQVYRDYAEKAMETTSQKAECQMVMTMKYGAQELKIDMDLDMQIRLADDRYEMAMTGAAKLDEASLPVEIYYRDGVCYVNIMGQKLKTTMDMEQLMRTAGGVDPAILLNYMDKLTFEAQKSGGVLSYRIGQANMNRYMVDAMALMEQAAPEGATAMAGFKMGSMVGQITLDKDGRAKAETARFNMFVTVEEETIPVSVQMDCSYRPADQEAAIQFPADLASYVDTATVTAQAAPAA